MILKERTVVDSSPMMDVLLPWKKAHGYTWQEVSDLTGVPRSNFSLWQKNRGANIKNLMAIRDTTGIPMQTLLGDNGYADIAALGCSTAMVALFSSEKGRSLIIEALKKIGITMDIERLRKISVQADYLVK